MKSNLITLFYAIILLVFPIYLNAQEVKPYGKWSFVTGIGIMQSNINDRNIADDENYIIQKKNAPQISIGVLLKIGENSFFHSGLRYNNYRSSSICKGWFRGPLSIDRDNYYYFPTYEADFTQLNKINTLSIPATFQFTSNQNKTIQFLFELGILNTFLIDNTTTPEGYYIRRGMYPDAQISNVFLLIENEPGYEYTRYNWQAKNVTLKTFFITAYSSIGFISQMNSRVGLFSKFNYQASLGDIVVKTKKDRDYQNLQGEQSSYQKTNLKGIGIEIGLIFKLKPSK